MHVRLKRKNQTIFLHVDPADNFFQIKTRVGEIHSIEAEKIQILGSDKVCEPLRFKCCNVLLCLLTIASIGMQKKEMLDLATISDQEVKNDDVLYLVFAKSSGGWEELQVDVLAPFGEEVAEEGEN